MLSLNLRLNLLTIWKLFSALGASGSLRRIFLWCIEVLGKDRSGVRNLLNPPDALLGHAYHAYAYLIQIKRIGLRQPADDNLGPIAAHFRTQHMQLREVVYVELLKSRCAGEYSIATQKHTESIARANERPVVKLRRDLV